MVKTTLQSSHVEGAPLAIVSPDNIIVPPTPKTPGPVKDSGASEKIGRLIVQVYIQGSLHTQLIQTSHEPEQYIPRQRNSQCARGLLGTPSLLLSFARVLNGELWW